MIGFIGGGNMASALIKGLTAIGIKDILVSEPNSNRAHYLFEEYGVNATFNNIKIANTCEIIILAVKPQIIKGILDEIKQSLSDNVIIVSIAAGITLSLLKEGLNTEKIARVMPNTPALVLEGMSVISFSDGMLKGDRDRVINLFKPTGKVLVLPEPKMNAVTALSGSGPAFIAYFIDAMIKGGIEQGLDEESAKILAVQTLKGTAKLLETKPPDILIKEVTSPGGTTEAGLKVLTEAKTADIIKQTILMAKQRGEELGKGIK